MDRSFLQGKGRGRRVKFIPNKIDLEKDIDNLFPAIEFVKGYSRIAENSSKTVGSKISASRVYKIFHNKTIRDEYECRIVIKEAKLFLKEIKDLVKFVE